MKLNYNALADNPLLKHREEIVIFKNIISDLPRGKSLDIGTGLGTYAGICSRAGFDALGVDTDRRAIEVAEKNNPGPKYIGVSFPEDVLGGYDLITAMTGTPQHFCFIQFPRFVNWFLNKQGTAVLSFWRNQEDQDFYGVYNFSHILQHDSFYMSEKLLPDKGLDLMIELSDSLVIRNVVNTKDRMLRTYVLEAKK